MRAVAASIMFCLGLVNSGWAVDRVVGVTAPSGGATLVKRIHVPAGTEVGAVEIVSNDLSTVFPAVRLRRVGEKVWTRGEVVCEATDVVPSNGSRHRFTVSLPHPVLIDDGDILVEVALPATSGVQVIGQGAGVGALDLNGSPTTSYIGNETTNELQAIDADLCVTLVGKVMAQKAGRSMPDAGTPPSGKLDLRVHSGREVEVRLATATAVVVAVRVYDVRGKLVRVLSQGELPSGEHRIVWDRQHASGHAAAAGVYFVVARVDGEEVTRKAVVLR